MSTSSTTVLEVRDLDVAYGTSQVLFGMGLDVAAGQTLALLGRNGAGKSTTMKAIAGVLPPRRGVVRLHGRDLAGLAPHLIARAGMAYVPEDRQIFPEHTVEENLTVAAKPGPDGSHHWTLERVYDMLPLLVPLKSRLGGQLSGGEQQMLTIGRALMGNPGLLLLDEPSEGLAPIIVQRIAELIVTLRKLGTTIVLAEQNLHFCLRVAERAVVIDRGRNVFSGTIAELDADPDVKRRYLSV
jgi:branched-chain amino acid transport system ATP-binding protein